MLQEERFNKILEELAESGAVKNIELSRKLNVSESTIRRDINELDELGELKKVFGGAVGIKKHVNTREEDIITKAAVHVEEKDIIAKYAAGFICDDDSVFIDAGTTTERMTDYITNRKATYMTNGIVHAQKLAQRGFRVNIVSGAVKKVTLSVIGVNAVKSLSNLNFTKCFMGTNGIDTESGFTTPDIGEAAVKTAVMKKSYVSFVLADHTKFGLVSPVTFADIEEACVITDRLEGEHYRRYTVIKEVEG